MGSRREGKDKKKKAVKANVTSKFGSKRRLSRMGKRVKKGEMGPSTEYITRSTALRRLQVSLKDFRRLCILKGIYPRVPSKAPKGADKVYYDIKDISYLAHEPLLHKFREFKSFMKKIRKAAGRKEFEEARRKNDLKPKFVLNHLIKERYPRFIDALRDLDDALCMVHLFAALPSQGRITTQHTITCSELVRQWQYYIAKSQTLQKGFISIKGVYFQAEILGEPITWLVPHQFTQAIPKEADMRVMTCFLEFYEVFLKFVLYKLYHNLDLQYPPIVNKDLSDAGCFLLSVHAVSASDEASSAIRLQDVNGSGDSKMPISTGRAGANSKVAASNNRISSLESRLSALEAEEEDQGSDDEDEPEESIAAPLNDAFSIMHGGNANEEDEEKTIFSRGVTYDSSGAVISRNGTVDRKTSLFQGMKFFVNREVPLDWLQLMIISAGGSVGWDGPVSPYGASDMGITHHIIDRPLNAEQSNMLSKRQREFVQPQWVFDCLNVGNLLPVSRYAPGVLLPPHLSPFVDDEKEGYTPKYREELKAISGSDGSAIVGNETGKAANESEDMEEDYEESLRAERSGKKANSATKKLAQITEVDSVSDDGSESDEEAESEDEKQAMKNSVSVPLASAKGPKAVVYEKKSATRTEDDEAKELSKTMMGKKTKRLYDRMQHGIQQKQQSVNRLKSKREEAEQNDQIAVKKQRIGSSNEAAKQNKAGDVKANGKKQSKNK